MGSPGVALDLAGEAVKAGWARRWLPVPEVLEAGADGNGSWLVSAALPGPSAVDPDWIARPEVAVPSLGRALRRWHDELPVQDCPFDWSVPLRLERAVGDTSALREPPAVDRVVVCTAASVRTEHVAGRRDGAGRGVGGPVGGRAG